MKWEDAEKVDSNLMRHALHELRIIGYGPNKRSTLDEMDVAFTESILAIINAFVSVGHSGSSAGYARGVINKLLSFENLTELTDDPDEWIEVGHDLWQNRRNSKAFSNNGGQHYSLLDDKEFRMYTSTKAPEENDELPDEPEEEENSFKQGRDT